MLSQFTQEHPSHVTLADLVVSFPKDVYPVGRLDKDSEGLLLLTNDKQMNQRLLHPDSKVTKTYLAQVEGIMSSDQLKSLIRGPKIKVNGKTHNCLPCRAELLANEPDLPVRVPPIRVRKNIPTCWVKIQITEGKNRQVRKMCAAVGCPALRLVRFSIGLIESAGMASGDVIEEQGFEI